MENIFLITLLACLLLSCGSTDSSQSAVTESELTGTWKSDCLEQNFLKHLIYINKYEGDNSSASIIDYGADATCISPEFIMTAQRTFKIVGDVEGLAGAKKIDYTYEKATLTPKGQDSVDTFNEGAFFSSTDWKLNEEKDITGKIADPTDLSTSAPAKGETVFYIIKVDGDKLITGDTSIEDGETEANRSTSLSSIILKKQ